MIHHTIRLAVAVGCLSLVVGAGALRAQSEEVFKPGADVTLPKPTYMQKPQYTAAALQAGIQGTVLLSMVVRADGTVGRVEVTRSLDMQYGLDEAAVEAARQWRFEAGKKDGKPVAVEVAMEMSFTLRERPQN